MFNQWLVQYIIIYVNKNIKILLTEVFINFTVTKTFQLIHMAGNYKHYERIYKKCIYSFMRLSM